MKRLSLISLLFLALLSAAPCLAQRSSLSVSLSGGWMVPNNFNMLEYSAPAFGSELTYLVSPRSEEWWTFRRPQSRFGIRASFAFIPGGIAGHRVGAVGLLRSSLRPGIDYHFGLGLSAYTRSAYFTHQRENIFITTLLSCLIDVGLDLSLSRSLSASLSLVHSSNGLLHRPNKGLNFLQLGLERSLFSPAPKLSPAEVPPKPSFQRREFGVALQLGMAMSRDYLVSGLHPCYDLSLNYQYYIDPVVAVGGTLDFWYPFSHAILVQHYAEMYTYPCYISSLAFLEGFWGPLSIKGGVGPVLVAPARVNVKIYERVGAYYNWGSNYIGVALNAHAGMIEFIEWCYGFRLKSD